MTSSIKVTFHPQNITVNVASGMTIKDAAIRAGISVDFTCGGNGRCGKCRVEVKKGSGAPNPVERRILSVKELKRNIRLACQSRVRTATEVFIPKGIQSDRKKSLLTIRNNRYQFNPIVKKAGLNYGLALDIGTTSVAGILVDLNTGQDMASVSLANAQSVHGADIISRIDYALKHKDGPDALQQKIISVINAIINKLTRQSGISREDINDVTIVGNTVMQHLLVKASVERLASLPFEPAYKGPMHIKAKELGIKVNLDANVYVFPHIAGFVGGDAVGLILALDLHHSRKINLAIDIGTNGEIVLGSRNNLLCTSTAAGPAFEGVRINSGTRASSGAIESLRLTDKGASWKTIDGAPATGICGSGLIDVLAEMVRWGIIDETGRFKSKEELASTKKFPRGLLDSIITLNKQGALVISKSRGSELVITQRDVRELQLAKAAIYAGIRTLEKQLGVADKDIGRIFIAGTFGNYINKKNARIIGLIPDVALDKVVFVGNASAEGSRMALVARNARKEIGNIIKSAQFLNLSADAAFQDAFADAMGFVS